MGIARIAIIIRVGIMAQTIEATKAQTPTTMAIPTLITTMAATEVTPTPLTIIPTETR